jgi:hypothetical protein
MLFDVSLGDTDVVGEGDTTFGVCLLLLSWRYSWFGISAYLLDGHMLRMRNIGDRGDEFTMARTAT